MVRCSTGDCLSPACNLDSSAVSCGQALLGPNRNLLVITGVLAVNDGFARAKYRHGARPGARHVEGDRRAGDQGHDDKARELSRRRALAVREALRACHKDVDDSRIDESAAVGKSPTVRTAS